MKKLSQKNTLLATIILILVVVAGALFFWSMNNQQNPTEQAESYIGLTEAEAQKKARDEQLVYRVVRKDNEDLIVTEDFREDRINVTVNDGKVTDAAFDSTLRERRP